jgi:hypothetical protein
MKDYEFFTDIIEDGEQTTRPKNAEAHSSAPSALASGDHSRKKADVEEKRKRLERGQYSSIYLSHVPPCSTVTPSRPQFKLEDALAKRWTWLYRIYSPLSHFALSGSFSSIFGSRMYR